MPDKLRIAVILPQSPSIPAWIAQTLENIRALPEADLCFGLSIGLRNGKTDGSGLRSREADGIGLRSGEADGIGLRNGEADGVGLRNEEADGIGLRNGEANGIGLRNEEADGIGLRNGEANGVGLSIGLRNGKTDIGNADESGWNRIHFQLDRRLFRSNENAEEEKPFVADFPIASEINEGRLRSLNLDVLINFCLLRYSDSLLDCARYGVWSLRDGRNRFVAGSLIGWRERAEKNPLLVCEVETTRRDQPPQIAMSATMASDLFSISRNQDRILWKASVLLPRALKELAQGGEGDFFAKARSIEKRAEISNSSPQTIRLFLSQVKDKALSKVQARAQWSLAIRSGEFTVPFQWEGFKRLVPPKNVFWADPFIVEREGRTYLFVEEFLYSTKRGRINCLEINSEGEAVSNRIVLERPYHLSYPFVFQERGEWYLIPETAGSRSIEVYRCARFPDRWEFHKTLMKNVRAVDATMFEYAGRWWMFVNLAERGNSTWDSLYLFYADSPLSDYWTPHPRNPIVMDVRSARPAGRLFRRDGKVFRPSQDCSVRYGYAINIHRVVTLTTTDYAEALEERIEPPARSDILAAHTLNFSSNWTVVDVNVRE